MDNAKLKRKDWQLLTAHSLIRHTAYMRVIMANQATIMSTIKNIPVADILKQMNKHIKDTTKEVYREYDLDIPNSPDYKF